MGAIGAIAGQDRPLNRATRLLLALLVGALVTLALYLLMAELVAAGRAALTDKPDSRIVDFVRLKREPELDVERPKPKKPDKPQQTPRQVTPSQTADTENVDSPAPDIGAMNVDTGLAVNTGFGLSASDGEYLPVVKVAPIYPRRAQSQGVEGWVLLEFTVSETGAVINPRVIEAEPSNVFDRAALQAVRKFKYKPRVQDGEPVASTGVQHLITFRLDE